MEENDLAFKCVNHNVAGPLRLSDDQVQHVLSDATARLNVSLRVLYVNTCLLLFSFHLFLLRDQKTLYCRTFQKFDRENSGGDYAFTRSKFCPFDQGDE